MSTNLRRLALAVATVMTFLGSVTVLGQEDTVASDAEALSVQRVISHWTKTAEVTMPGATGDDIHVAHYVMLAHETYFVADEREVPEGIADGTEVVFFVTETAHSGELAPDPLAFMLYLDDLGPLSPSAIEVTSADPHHRSSRVTFSALSFDGSQRVLVTEDTKQAALIAKDIQQPVLLSWHMDADVTVAPSLDLSDAPIIRVVADGDGYAPSLIEFTVGEPVILVFENPTDTEHHFHAEYLPIGDSMRWLLSVDGASLDTGEALRNAGQFDTHVCDSESGYCPTGAWVHLHANPGGRDAIAFIPQARGIYGVSCPLHDLEGSTIVVKDARGAHDH